MGSRINYGEGLIPSSFLPATPEKPIPTRSTLMPTEGQGNLQGRTNWQLAGFADGCLQDVSNYSRAAQHPDQIDQLFRNGGDNIRNAGMEEVKRMSNNPCNYIESQTGGLDSGLLEDILEHSNIATITSPMAPPSMSTSVLWSPSFPNLHPQVNNYRESSLFLGNQAHCSSSRQLGSNHISSQEPNCK